MSASTEIEQRAAEQGGALANRRMDAGLAENNGIINPARWQMLSAIAETVYDSEFVPKGLRGSAKKTLACLLYGDALGMQPMASLKEIHVIDGTPGLSAAAMQALVRLGHPGHRIKRIELRDESGTFLGVTVKGLRGDTEETDSYTFTLDMASRAGLMGKDNWKKYPEAMCSARALSQICTFLFPDVFMGSPYVPEEIESFGEIANVVAPEGGANGDVIVKPPPAPAPAPAAEEGAAAPEPATEQEQWEVANADTGECITYISADDRRSLAEAQVPFVKFPDIDGKFEIVGFEVDGATSIEKLLVRPEAAQPGRPAEGTPEAVATETIPKVFEYVMKARERGDIEYIKGVLAAENAKGDKARGRLVSQLEEQIATMEKAAVEAAVAGDGTGTDNPLLDDDDAVAPDADAPDAEVQERLADAPEAIADGEFTPLEDGSNDDDGIDHDASLAELDPEIPYGSATQRAKVVRLKALCAYMEDQHPEQKAWRLEGVVASAAKQWGGSIESVDDLDEHQLELIWNAAEKHGAHEAVAFLAITTPADIAKLAEPKA